MIRIAIAALTIAFAVGIVAIYGFRDGAIVLASFTGLAAFAAATVWLRRWAMRGCSEAPSLSDSSAPMNDVRRKTPSRRAA